MPETPSAPSPLLFVFIFTAFPIFFALLWTFVGFVSSAAGGWGALARHYKTDAPFEGELFRMRTASFRGFVNYKGVLKPGANERGLYLSVMILFRLWHPPLFIPWEDVSVAQKMGFLGKQVAFTFAKVPSATMRLSRGSAEDLFRASGRPELIAAAM